MYKVLKFHPVFQRARSPNHTPAWSTHLSYARLSPCLFYQYLSNISSGRKVHVENTSTSQSTKPYPREEKHSQAAISVGSFNKWGTEAGIFSDGEQPPVIKIYFTGDSLYCQRQLFIWISLGVKLNPGAFGKWSMERWLILLEDLEGTHSCIHC